MVISVAQYRQAIKFQRCNSKVKNDLKWHTALKLKYIPRRGPHVYLAAVFGGVTVEAFVPAVQIIILVGEVELILP